jgi:disease resistance protein RPM1
MAEAILIAVMKIGSILRDEAIKAIIAKMSEKVTNLKELPVKAEQIRKHLTMMSNVIRNIGTVYLTDKLVKSWIGEVRNVAYHVEDVMDKYSYHVLQLKKEGILKKFFIKGTHYVEVFSETADDVVHVEKEIQLVIQLKDHWLQPSGPSQLVANPLTEMERQQSQDSFPGFVKDDDLVGIEDNRILLTRWLYAEEWESTVITVSGMGGLGKSTLVSNVYEREKINFPAHAWIVVSQIYIVDALLRKLLLKIAYTEQ